MHPNFEPQPAALRVRQVSCFSAFLAYHACHISQPTINSTHGLKHIRSRFQIARRSFTQFLLSQCHFCMSCCGVVLLDSVIGRRDVETRETRTLPSCHMR